MRAPFVDAPLYNETAPPRLLSDLCFLTIWDEPKLLEATRFSEDMTLEPVVCAAAVVAVLTFLRTIDADRSRAALSQAFIEVFQRPHLLSRTL